MEFLLIYQAGIPGVSYHKLFDILDSTLNLPFIQAHDILDEITGYRGFLVDVSVRRYFKGHAGGTEVIQNLRDMMRELGDIAQESDLPEVAAFMREFAPSFELSLDELSQL